MFYWAEPYKLPGVAPVPGRHRGVRADGGGVLRQVGTCPVFTGLYFALQVWLLPLFRPQLPVAYLHAVR